MKRERFMNDPGEDPISVIIALQKRSCGGFSATSEQQTDMELNCITTGS